MKKSNLISSFKYAFIGVFSTIKLERNMKIHLLITSLVIIFGVILKISITEWFVCLILIGLVTSAECINTSIERTVDIISPTRSENAKIAKDTAAGAVLILAIISFIIGIIIFLPKIFILLK